MMATYRCQDCGAYFDEPYKTRICLEEYNGVASLFRDKHYITTEQCPYCDSAGFELTEEEEEWI